MISFGGRGCGWPLFFAIGEGGVSKILLFICIYFSKNAASKQLIKCELSYQRQVKLKISIKIGPLNQIPTGTF